jgi:membrane protein required for colicin V production
MPAIFHRLTLVDWLIITVLIFSTVRAAMHGLVRELFWFVGSILGLALACAYYSLPAEALRPILGSQPVADACSFLLIVFGVMLLAGLLGRTMRSALHFAGLGTLDSLVGGLFGLGRGILLITASMMAVAAFLPANAQMDKNISPSVLAPYFLSTAHAVSSVVPAEMEDRVRNGIVMLKSQWQRPENSPGHLYQISR